VWTHLPLSEAPPPTYFLTKNSSPTCSNSKKTKTNTRSMFLDLNIFGIYKSGVEWRAIN